MHLARSGVEGVEHGICRITEGENARLCGEIFGTRMARIISSTALDFVGELRDMRAALHVIYPAWDVWNRNDLARELRWLDIQRARILEQFEGIVWC